MYVTPSDPFERRPTSTAERRNGGQVGGQLALARDAAAATGKSDGGVRPAWFAVDL